MKHCWKQTQSDAHRLFQLSLQLLKRRVIRNDSECEISLLKHKIESNHAMMDERILVKELIDGKTNMLMELKITS